jgi:tetratricopeptide (TPR) repeat protein
MIETERRGNKLSPWRAGRLPLMAFLAVGVLVVAGYILSPRFRGTPHPADPASHWRSAELALKERDFPQAAAHLAHCLEAWPFNAEAQFQMARTSRRAGQLARWKKHIDRAESLLWPKDQIDLERKLRQAQVGRVWDVEESLMEILNRHTKDEVIILEALISGYLENDRLADVIFLCSRWSDRFHNDYLPLIYRGNARLRLNGKSSNAVKDFERVLELKPNHPEAHLSLAIVMADDGLFKQAVPHFQFYLENQPDDSTSALYGLASCQYSLGNFRAARALLDQLFERVKDNAAAYMLMSKIDLVEGQPEKALASLKKADTLTPNELDITHALLQVCGQLGQPEQADKYKHRLEEILNRDAELDRLVTTVKFDPDNPEARFQLAMVCLKLGREEEASHWFQGILFKDPDHLPTLDVLANYYQSKDNRKMADHYRRKADKVRGVNQHDTAKKSTEK